MPKQKYYYAVMNAKGKLEDLGGKPLIYTNKSHIGVFFKNNFNVVPIPADSLHKLIKEHTKKAK